MTPFRAAAMAGLLAVCALPATAATVILAFDGTQVDVGRTPYRESGVTFTVLTGHYDIFGTMSASAFNVDNSFTGPVEIEITFDGGRFDLLGFDVTDAPVADGAVFASDLGDIFTVPASPGAVRFAGAFAGISTLRLTYDSFVPFAFDDFAVDDRRTTDPGAGLPSQVPLPAGLTLLGAALGGLGLAGRRRRTRPARRG